MSAEQEEVFLMLKEHEQAHILAERQRMRQLEEEERRRKLAEQEALAAGVAGVAINTSDRTLSNTDLLAPSVPNRALKPAVSSQIAPSAPPLDATTSSSHK